MPTHREIRESLEGAERRAWREVEAFEESRPSLGSSVFKVVSAPLQTMVPEALTGQMQSALESLVDIVRRTQDWSLPASTVLEGSPYDSLEELRREAPVGYALELCEGQTGPAVLKATLQGAGLGFGGVLLAVADVPLLLVAHLRLLTGIGLCFGYDLCRPDQRDFLLALLKLGYCLSDVEEKQATLQELARVVEQADTPGPPSSGDEEVARKVFFKSIGAFSDKIGPILLRRRAGAMVPLIGSAFGAGSNYLLTQDVARAGRCSLLKRFLTERAR